MSWVGLQADNIRLFGKLLLFLGPVNTNLMVTVVTKKAPIKAQGAWFGESK
ncbi:hypothetical protein GP5015_1673 [gamma proteobacterium HTCC5015]|nr:hypothetical protein GP5015_1673 [gamma proteobacterium HTCC5015]